MTTFLVFCIYFCVSLLSVLGMGIVLLTLTTHRVRRYNKRLRGIRTQYNPRPVLCGLRDRTVNPYENRF